MQGCPDRAERRRKQGGGYCRVNLLLYESEHNSDKRDDCRDDCSISLERKTIQQPIDELREYVSHSPHRLSDDPPLHPLHVPPFLPLVDLLHPITPLTAHPVGQLRRTLRVAHRHPLQQPSAPAGAELGLEAAPKHVVKFIRHRGQRRFSPTLFTTWFRASIRPSRSLMALSSWR